MELLQDRGGHARNPPPLHGQVLRNKDIEDPNWKQLHLNLSGLPKNMQEIYRSEKFPCPSAIEVSPQLNLVLLHQ